MSKIIVFNSVTLDGVMQAPGRPDEDRRGGAQSLPLDDPHIAPAQAAAVPHGVVGIERSVVKPALPTDWGIERDAEELDGPVDLVPPHWAVRRDDYVRVGHATSRVSASPGAPSPQSAA